MNYDLKALDKALDARIKEKKLPGVAFIPSSALANASEILLNHKQKCRGWQNSNVPVMPRRAAASSA